MAKNSKKWILPNQCKMLAHLIFKKCQKLQFYPISVKCLRIPYRQAFYIDWVVSKNFVKNAKKSQKNENCPINVNCLPIRYAQAFYIDWAVLNIDWAVLKFPPKMSIYFYIDWAVLKYCPISVKCLRILSKTALLKV